MTEIECLTILQKIEVHKIEPIFSTKYLFLMPTYYQILTVKDLAYL